MSEYQYYEFQAIDKPLTEKDKQELRNLSSRARITSTSFINEYHWGDFKGTPLKLMEKYFDAFFYTANWGTHWLMLKVPKKLVDIELVKKYCIGDCTTLHEKNDDLIFEFQVETEDYEFEESEGELASLISLRMDLIRGDYRSLYLAWLSDVQRDDAHGEAFEPPMPANLNQLNASLEKFIEFMKIDKDLVEVAAKKSVSEVKCTENDDELKSWIEKFPEHDKNKIIFQLIRGDSLYQGTLLMKRFQSSTEQSVDSNLNPRKVSELLDSSKNTAEERERLIVEKKAEKRENYLKELLQNEEKTWKKISTLIETRQALSYTEAVGLLVDLREVHFKQESLDVFKTKIEKISEEHKKKSTFIQRLNQAGLTQ